jgi:tRNA pseudouridine55 synthase
MTFMQKKGRDITFEVSCSKGTYIRSLSEDLGRAMGLGAHLVDLRRLQVGPFHIDQAMGLEQLKTAQKEGRLHEVFYSMDDVLTLPTLRVHSSISHRVLCGNPIPRSGVLTLPKGLDEGARFKVHNSRGELLAIVSALFEKKGPVVDSEEALLFKVEKVLGFPSGPRLDHTRVS